MAETIDQAQLNTLLLDGLSGQLTWLEASKQFAVESYIATFYRTREAMERTLEDLNDDHVAYVIPSDSMWSISETVTHLIFSQNGYYNMLLDLTDGSTPHLIEAARGFGEGAKIKIPAQDLRDQLKYATASIKAAITHALTIYDAEMIIENALFGKINFATWMLLLLGHEVDHVRQSIIMRRTARIALKQQIQK